MERRRTKHHFWSNNGAQNRSQDPLFRSWRPVSRKIDPKTRPRALLQSSGDGQKKLDTPKRAPRKFPSHFGHPSKHTPPPRWGAVGGGSPFSAPAFWLPFLENRCWRLGGVQKSRSPGLQGPLLGEKLKLLQQQASLLFKASLREA